MNEHQEGQGHGKGGRRKLVLYAVGFVLLTDVLTLVFLQVFSSGDEPAAPAVVLARQPVAAGGVDTSTAVATAVATGASREASPGVVGPARASGRSTAPQASGVAVADELAAVSQVMVTSIPTGATLRVNRQTVGITPVAVPVPAGGRVAVVVLLPGYETRTIVLRPWEERVRVRMKPEAPAEPVPAPVSDQDQGKPGSQGATATEDTGTRAGTPAQGPVTREPGTTPAASKPGNEARKPSTASAAPGAGGTPRPEMPDTPVPGS